MLTGVYKFRCRLLPQPSHIRQFNTWSCKQFTPKTKRRKHSPTIRIATCPHFTVISVQDTHTYFKFCCSFDWKPKTNGSFVLRNITCAVDSGELAGSPPSWMQDPPRSHEIPICSDIDLAEIRCLRKLDFNLMNNSRGGHCFVSSRAKRNTGGKITTYKHDYLFLDSGIRWGRFSFIFLSKLSEFPFVAFLWRKLKFMTPHVSMLLKSRFA